MGWPEQIERLTGQSLALEETVTALSRQSFPSKGAPALCSFIQAANRQVLERLSQLSQTFNIYPEEEIELILCTIGLILAFFHRLLEFVAQADVASVPAPLVPLLDRLAKEAFEGAEVILRHTWEFNYEELSFQELADQIRGALQFSGISVPPELPPYLVVLSFPAAEKDNILLHCALAHEMGHFYDSASDPGISEGVDINIGPPADLRDLRHEELASVIESIKRWYAELFCDLVGIWIFGPAYFLAFVSAVRDRQPLLQPGFTHPDPLMRLALMLSVLVENGFVPANKTDPGMLDPALKAQFEEWREILGRHPATGLPVRYRIVRDAVVRALPALKQAAEEFFAQRPTITYSAGRYESDVAGLVDRLVKFIPPDEVRPMTRNIGELPHFVSTLNAGWVVLAARMDEVYGLVGVTNRDERHQARRMVGTLVLKAIENNVIRHLWSEIV